MMLSSVFTTQPYWYNKARFLSVLAQKWQGTDPDSVQMLMLESTADQCPLEGGEGVYMARGILEEYQTEPVLYDDTILCDSIGQRSTSFSSTNVIVYPNPSQEIYNFESSENMTLIEIFDNLGNMISVWKPESKVFQISLSALKGGMYHVRISFSSGSHKAIKKILLIP